MKRLVFMLIVALLPLEGVARLWLYMDPLNWFHERTAQGSTDPEIIYELRPGSRLTEADHVNSWGMRGHEPNLTAPNRVLVIGDSVTFGPHVSDAETFARRLETALPFGWDVANGGVSGYQTWQERRRLEQLDPLLQPTAVVVAWCTNDGAKVSQMTSYPAVDLPQQVLFATYRPSPIGLIGAARMIGLLREGAAIKRQVDAKPPDLRWPGEWEEAWDGLLRRASTHGRATLAVVIPPEWALDGVYYPRERPIAGAARVGVPVLDLLNRFQSEPDGTLYLPDDPIHLSPRGHQVVAEEILSALGTLDPSIQVASH